MAQIEGFATLADRRRGRLFFAPLLITLLLFAQTVELAHHHDGALEPDFDCEICLKLGSQFKAATVSGFNFDIVSVSAQEFPTEAPCFSHAPGSVTARGPPRLPTV